MRRYLLGLLALVAWFALFGISLSGIIGDALDPAICGECLEARRVAVAAWSGFGTIAIFATIGAINAYLRR